MKGLELCQQFYDQFGAPMIREEFPLYEPLIAVGIAGSGSECFGYDDELSQDHDFEPGFCLFLPDEDIIDRKTEFQLERAYSKLPKEFMGFKRSLLSPVGGNRHGVIRMRDFFDSKTGTPDGVLSLNDWFYVPEQALAEATNGMIFKDDLGQFSSIRQRLDYFPDDVRLKKLAGALLIMGQSGQYNYGRCISRGETAAAQLSVSEFVRSVLSVIFILNKRYQLYYKWSFRALRDLPKLSHLSIPLEKLISSGNDAESVCQKLRIIDEVAAEIISELLDQKLSDHNGQELEAHAYSVNNMILDGAIRNLHILYAT